MHRVVLIASLAAAALGVASGDTALSPEVRRTAETLRERLLAGSQATRWIQELTDRAGPRLAGSPGDREAVEWVLETLRTLGFANVHTETVTVRVWQRGAESGEIVSPQGQRLALTALGGSVPTPDGGLEAEILEVASLQELDAKAAAARGKIVFFNKKMERREDFRGYAAAVDVRSDGASRAARYGAVGVLIRSIGTDHNRLAHTGALSYEDKVPRLPAAALSIPDADLLERLLGRGQAVRVHFVLSCGTKGETESANVVGEIPGATLPEEIVLLGAHLDSWDLGRGAIDDGAGCGIVLEAARWIGELPRRPARTIRVVLFANEENGLAGAKAYARAHVNDLSRHVAALEADSGAGRPTGLTWIAGASAEPAIREIASLLESLGAGTVSGDGTGGADIGELRSAGVPLFSVSQDVSRYFDDHHTANDTLDKIEPMALDRSVAAVAVVAYCAASVPNPFERIPQAKRARPKS
jgi:carboxypeptidase Q